MFALNLSERIFNVFGRVTDRDAGQQIEIDGDAGELIEVVHRFDRNAGKGPVAIAADYLKMVIIRK